MKRIFDLWPDVAALAADLGKPYTTVASWRSRRSMPARYDLQLVEAAQRRGLALTLEDIAKARSEASGASVSDAA